MLASRQRRLASYTQADFEAACSTLAFDVDANGVVEQADIEMFTYYLLNRQALDEKAFCARLQQWLYPTLDGRSNTKDWIYFWQANANNKLLVTNWQSECSSSTLSLVAEVKRFDSSTVPSDTEVYFEPHFVTATGLALLVGSDTTSSDCQACVSGQQYALQGSVSSSETAGVWTSTYRVRASVDVASVFQLGVYIKTQARSGDSLLVDSIARLSSFGGTLIDDSWGYGVTSPYAGQSAVLPLADLYPQLSPSQCFLSSSPPSVPAPPTTPASAASSAVTVTATAVAATSVPTAATRSSSLTTSPAVNVTSAAISTTDSTAAAA